MSKNIVLLLVTVGSHLGQSFGVLEVKLKTSHTISTEVKLFDESYWHVAASYFVDEPSVFVADKGPFEVARGQFENFINIILGRET